LEENTNLQKQLNSLLREKATALKKELISKITKRADVSFIAAKIQFESAEEIKNILFEMRNEVADLFCVLAAEVQGKPSISVIISDHLVKEKNLNAGNIVRDLAKEINGGGGGQPFYAQAGGSKPEGLDAAIAKAELLF
jgi:alanyl-tRNA synthetase